MVDSTGRCLGLGTAGSGNPVSSGQESVALALGAALRQAIASAGVRPASIAGAAVAMAGSRSVRLAAGPEHPGITAGLSAAGVDAPFVVESDLLAMFCAGSSDLDGHALVAGTGSAAIRVRDGEVEAVADGTGWLLGDEGSGFWIGHHVVRAVVADLDGRGPSTGLTPLVLAGLGIDDTHESRRSSLSRVTEIVYGMRPVQLARFAPVAFEVGDDEAALAIVEGAAQALARTLGTVLDDGIDGPLVLGEASCSTRRVSRLPSRPPSAARAAPAASSGSPTASRARRRSPSGTVGSPSTRPCSPGSTRPWRPCASSEGLAGSASP